MAEPIDAASDVAESANPDPVEMLMRQEAVKTALSRFVELPTLQRSVVILKDVLDESLMEIAALLDLTIDAVKGHLARGRARLRRSTRKPARFRTPGRRPPRWRAMSRSSTSGIGRACERSWPTT
jgi:RNA polymerase sigma-70 factor (ECF subfamily)